MKRIVWLLVLIASAANGMDSKQSGVFSRFAMMDLSKGLGDVISRNEDSCARASVAKDNRKELEKTPVLTQALTKVSDLTREASEKKEREEREVSVELKKEADQMFVTERTYALDAWQALLGNPYTTNVAFNHDATLIAAGSHATHRDGSSALRGPSLLNIWRLNKQLGLQGVYQKYGSQEAHGYCTYCLDFNPENNEVATGGWDGAVKLWCDPHDDGRYQERQMHQTSEDKGKEVVAIAFSPDGDMLAASSMNKKVYFLRRNEQTYCSVSVPLDVARRVDAITFRSPQTLVLGMDDGTIQFCSKEHGTFKPVSRIENQESNPGDWINSLTFNNEKNILAVCSNYSGVRLFEFDNNYTYKLKQQLQGHEKGVMALDFSTDDKQLISGCEDGSVHIWEQDEEGNYQRVSQTKKNTQYSAAAVRCLEEGDPLIALLEKIKGVVLVSRLREKIQRIYGPQIEDITDTDSVGSASSSYSAIQVIACDSSESDSSVASE